MKKLSRFMAPLVNSFLFNLSLKAAGFAKMSFIVGSHAAFFSASNILLPLGGLWLGPVGLCFWFAIGTGFRFLIGNSLLTHLIYGIPGFCAALYMAYPNVVVRVLIPIICMFFFIVHPVGIMVVPYTFYWLIPIVLYFIKKRFLFTEVLGATFVAHAVGSVFWLYVVPMPASYWWRLIPIVACERLCFAVGAVAICSGSFYFWRLLNVSFFKLKKKLPAN